MPSTAATGNTAPVLTTLMILGAILSTSVCAVRSGIKLKSSLWNNDDVLALSSLCMLLVRLVTEAAAIHHGLGNPWATLATADADAVNELIYAAQILYLLSIGAARSSTIRTQVVTIAHTVWTVASVLAVSIRRPFAKPWSTREGTEDMFVHWLAIEAVGLALEIWAVVLSMNTARKLQIVQQKRVILYALFSSRLIVIPLIGLRLYWLSPSAISEQTPSLSAYEWTDVVINASLIVSCISCVSPKGFLKPFHSDQGRSTAASTTGESVERKEYPGAYAELQNWSSSASMSNRAKDVSGSKTVVESWPIPDEEEATVSLAMAAQPCPRSTGGIARTQDWTVVHVENVL